MGEQRARPTECPRSLNRGIAHHLDDWGPEGGHEWPYWHHQMWEYIGQHSKELFAWLASFTMAKKVTGGCACGSIRYQLLDKPMFVHCCHCDDCQRLTGSAFVLNAIIETQAIKLLSGKPVAVPVPRENGPHEIYRCPRCQTPVWSEYGHKPNIRYVRVGTLDKPGRAEARRAHLHPVESEVAQLPKRTPSFRDYYNTSKLWPKASFKRLNAALGRNP